MNKPGPTIFVHAATAKCQPQQETLPTDQGLNLAQVSESIQTAIAHHQAGRLAEAEAIYRQVLIAAPVNFDALHLLVS